MKEILHSVDVFAKPITLSFNQKPLYSTFKGIILTVVLLTISALAFYYFGK
jgi:hypothetical protein